MPSSLDASASAQEQTKGREPMPPFSASSKHAGDENSTRGRSSPKPSQTPEGASRLPCCLLPCCQPDKGVIWAGWSRGTSKKSSRTLGDDDGDLVALRLRNAAEGDASV